MLWRADLGPHTSRLLAAHLSLAQLAVKEWIANIRTILQASLREFKEIGIKLALDDFGTRYSSLPSLH